MSYRGTTNRNARGGSPARRARRRWLVQTFRADQDLYRVTRLSGFADVVAWQVTDAAANRAIWEDVGATVEQIPACRCYRCGILLTEDTVSPDRIIPGCEGGTYRRENIRPACEACQSLTGAMLGLERRSAIKGELEAKAIERSRHPGKFQGVVRAQVETENGSQRRQVFGCTHKHSSQDRALECAKSARKVQVG